jgi:2-octaprenyl-6-methoxyphenol hydroxylase
VDRDFDLVIVGGGMVGASLAVALSPLPLRVALVEPFAPDSDAQPSYDDRCTAISHGSQVILNTMGVWQDMQADASPIARIHVSEQGRPGIARLEAREQGVPALGYVVPNRSVGKALWKRLSAQSNLQCFMPAKLVSMRPGKDAMELDLEQADGQVLSVNARLVVAVDGARSVTREMAGIDSDVLDYQQTAIICNVTPEQDHQGQAFERFTTSGPLAVLPLGEKRCSVVWTVKRELAESIMALDDENFLLRLQEQFGYRLGRLLTVGRRSSYPLYRVKARQQLAQRLVVLGNAAHNLHPVAGQGFNLSLRDVAALAEVMASLEGVDPGTPAMLEQYMQWRREDQDKVLGFTHGLVRLFTSPFGPVKLARSAGLLSFDLVPGAKKLFARHTMGRAGRLPRLARGVPLV